MTSTEPAIVVRPQQGGWQVACSCGDFGWWQINNPGDEEFATIEEHAVRCDLFKDRARDQIDGLGDLLGAYIPVEIRDLFLELLDTPTAGALMRWLADLEDTAHGD